MKRPCRAILFVLCVLELAALCPKAAETADAPSHEAAAEERYRKAIQLHTQGRLDEAVTEYTNAIMLNPKVAAYFADLGEAYRAMGDTRSAIASLKKAVAMDPRLANALTTIGVIHDGQNLPIQAIAYHRMAIKADPTHYIAYNNLGHAYDQLGLTKAAMANYEKAIAINPKFAPPYDNIGTEYMKQQDPDRGVEWILKAVELAGEDDPQLGLYYNDLGAAYVMKKEFLKARDAFRKAVNLIPQNEDIARNLRFVEDYINEKK